MLLRPAKSIGLKTGFGSSLSSSLNVKHPIAWHPDDCGVRRYVSLTLKDVLIWISAVNSIGFTVKITDFGVSLSSKFSNPLKIT